MGRSKSHKSDFKDLNASLNPKKDNFGTIYVSMLQSEQFKSLSLGAQKFYMICRAQMTSEDNRRTLFKHGAECDIHYTPYEDFVFPTKHLEKYGYKRQNANKYFNELIEHGFIAKREQNKAVWKVNVYSFSDKWKKPP